VWSLRAARETSVATCFLSAVDTCYEAYVSNCTLWAVLFIQLLTCFAAVVVCFGAPLNQGLHMDGVSPHMACHRYDVGDKAGANLGFRYSGMMHGKVFCKEGLKEPRVNGCMHAEAGSCQGAVTVTHPS
jgi:hypothetical protein